MSPGDQIISVLVDSLGVFLEAIISSFFDAFVVPFFDEVFAALGFGGM